MSDKIILIRHGESLANVEPQFWSYPDPVNILTSNGALQAHKLSETVTQMLKVFKEYTVISSVLTRAKLTADIALHNHNVEIKRDARLNECPWADGKIISLKYAESNESVRARVGSLLDDHPGTLILFCHAELMFQLDPSKPLPHNTEIRGYDRQYFINNHILKNNRCIVV